MSEHTVKVIESSYWRDSESAAKDECNRRLDTKVRDTISREDHDGFELVSSQYSSYSLETKNNNSLYRCTRSKTLRFREYDPARINEINDENDLPLNELLNNLPQEIQQKLMSFDKTLRGTIVNAPPETEEEYFARIDQRIREALPPEQRVPLIYAPITALFPQSLTSFTISTLTITKSMLKLADEGEIIGIPLSETVVKFPINNCGKTVRIDLNRDIEYEFTTGYRITTEHSITDKYEISGTMTFGEGNSLGGSFSREVSFRQSQEYSTSQTERRSQKMQFTIEPNTKAIISITSRKHEMVRSFEGPVTVDCTIYAIYGIDPALGTKQFSLSQLLSEDERSFTLKGHYASLDTQVHDIDIEDIGC